MRCIIRFVSLLLVLVQCLAIAGCSSPEQKRDRFMAKAAELEAGGDHVRARLEFKNAIQVDPDCVECYAGLGRTEQAVKNLRGAYAAFSRAVELDPGRLDLQLALGQLLFAGRAQDKAAEKARLILAKEPENPEALALLATALAMQKEGAEEALATLDRLRRIAPERPEGYIVAAGVLSARHRTQEALALLEKGLASSEKPAPYLQALIATYARDGAWPMALSVAERLVALDPDDATFRQMEAEIYERLGQTENAAAAWKAAADKDPSNPALILGRAAFWLRQKDNARAEELLRHALKDDPAFLQGRISLARLLAGTRRSEEGLALLGEVNKDDLEQPQRLAVLNEQAGLRFLRGELAEAEGVVDTVLKESPKDAAGLLLKARLAIAQRRGDAAVTALRTLVNDAPASVELRILLAQAHLLNGETRIAEEQIQSAIEAAPTDERPRRVLVNFYIGQGDLARGQQVLSEALGAFPKAAVFHHMQGDLCALRREAEAAEASYRKAIEIAPQWLPPYRNLAALLAGSGKVERAERGLKEAVAKNPAAWHLQLLLASFYESAGKPDEAVRVYESLLDHFPESPLVANNLAYLLAEHGRDPASLSRAKDLAERAVAGLPDSPMVLDTQAWVLFRSGAVDAALEVLRDALAKEPDHLTLLHHQGVILAALGRKEEAREVLARVVEDKRPFPEREESRRLLSGL